MKHILIFLLVLILFGSGIASNSYKKLYKRLNLGFTKWQKFIHSTASHYVNTTIECGGVCNSHFDDCDLFVYHKNIERCHVGKFEIDSQYLDGYSGTFPIHLSMDKLIEDFEKTYYPLTYVQDESKWKKFIFKTEPVESPANELDCSFLCKNVQKWKPCDLFVFKAGNCYSGRSKHTGQGIEQTLENVTVYATEDSMNTIKDGSGFAYKTEVISSRWTAHIRNSHQDAISIQIQCEAMAVLEYWHYSVFDPENNYCYFGIISMDSLMANTQAEGEEGEIPPPTAGASTSEVPPSTNGEAGEFKPFIVDDTTSRQLQINTGELGFFPVDYFTERSSVIYQPFTYSVFANPLNKEHCSIHCAFDTDYKCDFWFIHHSHCYLGSFNQEGGIGVQNSHETITAYIFKDFVSNMMDKLYFTAVDVQNNQWSKRIRETFSTVSDYECGGHAALADNEIDYWIWIDGNCFLGDIVHGSSVFYDDDIKNSINIYRENSWKNLDDNYNEKFTLSDYIWTKYIFDTYPLEDLQDSTECGVRCELSGDQCDFFTTHNGECHLGRYNHWDLGEVQSTAVPMTYHKQDQIRWVKKDNFRWWSSGNYWYKWIYKIEEGPTSWKCFFECYHDDTCDYFVDVHNFCCYGDFQHTGSPATTWTDDVMVYVKNGRKPDTSYITTYFNDAYGGGTNPNSVLRWWPYGIWAHYDNVENSEQCAFRCYIRKVDDCAFYYWGSGHCHLGNFNSQSHNLFGDYDENTKYHIRKDFDFADWSKHYNSQTNDGSCQNYGYRQLNWNGQYIDITSGGHSYDNNERCYWGIYAPGAQILRFQLTNDLRTESGDYLNVHLGVGPGGYNVLHFWDYHSETCCWEYEAELMSIYWYTNHYDVAYGFKARITRIG